MYEIKEVMLWLPLQASYLLTVLRGQDKSYDLYIMVWLYIAQMR